MAASAPILRYSTSSLPFCSAAMALNMRVCRVLPFTQTKMPMFQTKTKQVIGFLSAACSASSALVHAEYVQKETSNAYAQTTYVESDANQLTGMLDKRRVDVTASNLAVINIFDNGAFAHDAHTQYVKWALLSPLAYDFTADARSYSRGAAIEYFHDETNLTVDVEVFSRGRWNDRASIATDD